MALTAAAVHGPHNRKPWVKTPLIESAALSKAAGCRIFLKLEHIQPSGSFKSRGIGNLVLSSLKAFRADPSKPAKPHLLCSSGGNAGLACVTAAVMLDCAATIVVPISTKPEMIEKIRTAGAYDVIQEGETWFHADTHLRNTVLPVTEGGVYVPPFDHPDIWTGASSMVTEWDEQLAELEPEDPRVDGVVCSVGGGGLFCGIMQGLESSPSSSKPPVCIAVETIGADSLYQAVQARELVTLPGITSIATTLGAVKVCAKALENGLKENARSVTVTDEQAASACVRYADDLSTMVEASCGAALAVAYDGMLPKLIPNFSPESKVILVVCGGRGISAELLAEYRMKYTHHRT